MCVFFSAILDKDGAVHFCEDDSHEAILARLGWPDDRPLETRGWVRVERKWTGDTWLDVRVDETSVPAWYTEDRARYEGLVCETAERVQAALAAYQAAKQAALAAYQAVVQAALAAYQAVVQPAWAAYEAVKQSARAACQATLSAMTGYVPTKEE